MSSLRILTIADAHGRKPVLAKKLIKKYNPDILICTGDIPLSDVMRKITFKHWDELSSGKTYEEIIGKKKLILLEKKTIHSMYGVLDYLDSLGKPLYMIYGNHDFNRRRIKDLSFKAKSIEEYTKKCKNIKLMISSRIKIGDVNLIAISGYRRIRDMFISNKEFLRKVQRLYSGIKRKNTILLYHDVPYNTKFDLVRNKESPMNREHVGDPIVNKIIKKYKPLLYICGHMHENPGVIKMGRTICLNTGLIEQNDYFIINIKDSNVSVKRVK